MTVSLDRLVLPPRSAARLALDANATLAARRDVTATLAAFVVDLDQALAPFHAGQYVSLGVAHDGAFVQRPYSIVAADRTRTRIELFIRRLPTGRLSNILWRLPVGSRVRIGPPRGLFRADDGDDRPRLLIGTGTGLAPLLAILADGVQRAVATPSVLIHGVSYQAELAYADRVAAWQAAGAEIDYRPTVSRPAEVRNAGWAGRTGRAEDQLQQLLDERPEARGWVTYLCGNADMIAAARAVLAAAGTSAADVRVEHFHAPSAAD